jgi:2'-5' RNA ligase
MRLFVALEAPEILRQGMAALQECLRPAVEGVGFRARWVPEPQMHLTLAFLGEVEERRLGDLEAALREVAGRHPPFEVPTTALGASPSPQAPRVLFLGAAPCDRLHALAADLQRQLAAAGFATDPKPFHPHLALARLSGKVEMDIPPEPLALPGILPARQMALIRSFLAPLSRHEVLARWELGEID